MYSARILVPRDTSILRARYPLFNFHLWRTLPCTLHQHLTPLNFFGDSRFSTYLTAAGGDTSLAYDLYAWNTRLAGAFHEVLGHAEVAVRNAIDTQLRDWNQQQTDNPRNPGKTFTEQWCIDTAIPLYGLVATPLKKARNYAGAAKSSRPSTHARKHAEITHDDLVSQLSFGTWNHLVPWPNSKPTPQLHLWEEAVKNAFPGIKPGIEGLRQVKKPLNNLHHLRNRVAHCKPLLQVEANRRLQDIARLTGYIDQPIADWIMGHQRVRDVARERPAT